MVQEEGWTRTRETGFRLTSPADRLPLSRPCSASGARSHTVPFIFITRLRGCDLTSEMSIKVTQLVNYGTRFKSCGLG